MQPLPGNIRGHEFDTAENQIIRRLAKLMKITGVVQMLVGVLQLGGFLGRTFALREEHAALRIGVDLPVAIAFFAGGLLLFLAAPPFDRVVDTEGHDIEHIMSACSKLTVVMTILASCFALATVVWLVLFVVFLVSGTPLLGSVE